MSTAFTAVERTRPALPSMLDRFLALVHYELLSSLRRKKVLVITIVGVALVALQVFLPGIIDALEGRATPANPEYAVSVGAGGFGGDVFSTPLILVFAIAVAMDTIPLEFEVGSIATLLSKPVTRGMVFLSKWFTVMLVLAILYAGLFLMMLGGAHIVYGPQTLLHLYPGLASGALLAILVYAAIVFMLAAVFRSSMIAAVVGFGGVFALVIAGFAISFAGHPGIALHLPGPGPPTIVVDAGESLMQEQPGPFGPAPSDFQGPESIQPGTHNIGPTLVFAARNPGKEAVLIRGNLPSPEEVFSGDSKPPQELLREPVGSTAARSVTVAVAYIVGLLGVAWAGFYRAEVLG